MRILTQIVPLNSNHFYYLTLSTVMKAGFPPGMGHLMFLNNKNQMNNE